MKACSATDCRDSGLCPIGKTACPGVCIYSEIFDNIDLGIVVIDVVKEEVVFANPCSVELLDLDTSPLNYHALSSILLSQEVLSSADWGNRSFDLQLNDKLLGYSIYPIPGERFIWAFIRNITEKMRLESIANAVNTMDNLGYVFSGIRHEIGNPINSAKMALSVLKEGIHDFSTATILEFVERSMEELLRVEFLLKSLRNINMYEKPVPELINLGKFLDRFVSLVWEDFSKSGIRINTTFHPHAQSAFVDPRALQQVLLNIFTNAADAMVASQDKIIEISTMSQRGFVWLQIRDTGCGVPEDKLEEIFKPFYTTKTEGTGLGLVISRKMLAQMNCTIDISNCRQGGTMVAISLPEGDRLVKEES